ncbi:MAG: alkaline phosphatase family protein [Abditibacteriales bacterium]|nr:alkaline phosphatase family protein [Abditibacteriales bacterium]MDW8367495.1 alkaline phosphatase family protein [Abditibacteriales bacterium]
MDNAIVQRALLITVDGFDPSYLDFPDLPTLRRLGAEGAVCLNCSTTFPTLTTSCLASLLTGTYPATHGIPSSAFYDKATDTRMDAPRGIAVPTVAEVLKAHGHRTAAVAHFLLEHRGADVYLPASANMAEQVARVFATINPTFLALYLGATDEAGHRFGPTSSEMRRVVQDVDRQIGDVLTELERRGWLREAVVVITSDHGMTDLPAGGGLTGRVETALQASGVQHEYAASRHTFRADTEVVWMRCVRVALVWERRPLSPEKRERLLNALRNIEGIETIVDAAQLKRLRASPRVADYVLIPARDKHFATGDKGGHGSFAEMHVPLLLWGAGVQRGALTEASNVDVVPTLLRLLDVPIPEHVEGEVLKAATWAKIL